MESNKSSKHIDLFDNISDVSLSSNRDDKNYFSQSLNSTMRQDANLFDKTMATMEEICFLEKGNNFEKVIMASYPRSGNTMLRNYVETITGIYSGSDGDIRRKLNSDLSDMGLKGEGIVDDRVWLVKSHFPERTGAIKFNVHKCLLLVRNPLDAFDSLFNMIATGSHNQSIQDSEYKKFEKEWNIFVEEEILVWKDFHAYWLGAPIPTFIIRYEDLLTSPKDTLLEMFSFLLNVADLEGSKIEQKIIDIIDRKHSKKKVHSIGAQIEEERVIYKPRVGKINSHVDKYSAEQITKIKHYLTPTLKKFNYIGKNTTKRMALFEDSSDEEEEGKQSKYNDWISTHNSKVIKEVSGKYTVLFNGKKERAVKYEEKMLLVNDPKDIVRKVTEDDPAGRGQKALRLKLRNNVLTKDK